MNDLELEFLEYQATPDDEFPAYFEDNMPMRIDHIWHQISEQIDIYSGQPRFKHLAEFPNFLLSIPHNNSYCESIFSTIRKICTDASRQGHASSNVYAETRVIRNNLLGILIPKINTFTKKLACCEWEPTKYILAQAKSATCNIQKPSDYEKLTATSSSWWGPTRRNFHNYFCQYFDLEQIFFRFQLRISWKLNFWVNCRCERKKKIVRKVHLSSGNPLLCYVFSRKRKFYSQPTNKCFKSANYL